LALSSAQNASATIEISYDDGTPERGMGNPANQYMAVRFSLPFAPARLVMARFWPYQIVGDITVHIFDGDGVTPLTSAFIFTLSIVGNWNDAPLNIVVTGDFYIAVQWIGEYPDIGYDTTPPVIGRSYFGTPGNWGNPVGTLDSMIRAEVDAIGAVGGVVVPVNTLAVLAPWLAVIGLVAIGTLVVVAKKREKTKKGK
jgi:hypothetical protein